jgi:hypothetical protein
MMAPAQDGSSCHITLATFYCLRVFAAIATLLLLLLLLMPG